MWRRSAPSEPTMAYIVTKDDEMVECLIESMRALVWRVTPVRHVGPREVKQVYVDLVPEGGTIEFIFEREEF